MRRASWWFSKPFFAFNRVGMKKKIHLLKESVGRRCSSASPQARRDDAREQKDDEARDDGVRRGWCHSGGEADGGPCAALQHSAAEGNQPLPRAAGQPLVQHYDDWLGGTDRQAST